MRCGSFEVPLSDLDFEFDLSFLDDADLPPVIGRHVEPSYVEVGLIELATFLAREEGR